jgi:hypothetical protein
MDDLLVRLLRHRQAVAHVTTLPSTLLLASFVLTVPLVAQTIARRRLAAVMAIFYSHDPILAAMAIPHLGNYSEKI